MLAIIEPSSVLHCIPKTLGPESELACKSSRELTDLPMCFTFHNKISQTLWLKIVLEAESLKSRHHQSQAPSETYKGIVLRIFLASGTLLEIFRILWLVEALCPPSPTICLYLHMDVFLGSCLYVHISPFSFVFWPHHAVCRVLLIVPCAAVTMHWT